jgi:Na+/melibiose symporter-like transporter
MAAGLFLEGNQRAAPALAIDAQTNFSFRVSQGDFRMLVGALVTFLVVILILYLINLLPLDGRAKQICRVVVIVLGVISLLKYIAVF